MKKINENIEEVLEKQLLEKIIKKPLFDLYLYQALILLVDIIAIGILVWGCTQ